MPGKSSQQASTGKRSLPGIMPGFEHVKHYWDTTHEVFAARILPGEYYVSRENVLIATVLGSCISACVRDRTLGIGGMNHFMLPEGGSCDINDRDCVSQSARYGSYAMEHLINTILANGGKRERLEIKLFGGGKVLKSMTDVGSRNIAFVRNYLRTETLPVVSEDLGGLHPRKVLYFPATGRVLMRKLPLSNDNRIEQQEMAYQRSLQQKPVAGDIDLF